MQHTIEIVQQAIGPIIMAGIQITIPLSIISFIIGLIIAILTALGRISKNKVVNAIFSFYVWIIRGTPLIVQLVLVYFGFGKILKEVLGIDLSAFVAATWAFSLSIGAYGSEIIRASIAAINKGQWEAASALGMGRTQVLTNVIIPQALRISVPPLSNSFIGLVKDTSLATSVTLIEMFGVSQQFAASTYEPMILYVTVAAVYLFISTILTYVQSWLEKRYAILN